MFLENNCLENKKIRKLLNLKFDEPILWTGFLNKINYSKSKKPRYFILTNKNLYNLGSGISYIKNLLGFTINSKINIREVNSIINSNLSFNFVIRMLTKKDLYLNSDQKDIFLEKLFFAKNISNQPIMPLFSIEEINLYRFVNFEKRLNLKITDYEFDLIDYNIYDLILLKINKNKNIKFKIYYGNNEIDLNKFNFQITDTILKNKFYKLKFENENYFSYIINLDIIKNFNFKNFIIFENQICKLEHIFIKNYLSFKYDKYFIILKDLKNYKSIFNIKRDYYKNQSKCLTLLFKFINILHKLQEENIVLNQLSIYNILIDEEDNIKLCIFKKNKKDIDINNNLINVILIIYQIFHGNLNLKISDFEKDYFEIDFNDNHEINKIFKLCFKNYLNRPTLNEFCNSDIYFNIKNNIN